MVRRKEIVKTNHKGTDVESGYEINVDRNMVE
jgi:hypothetical protein